MGRQTHYSGLSCDGGCHFVILWVLVGVAAVVNLESDGVDNGGPTMHSLIFEARRRVGISIFWVNWL